MKSIAVLGSTGSVGSQTLDIINKNKNIFKVKLLGASKVSEKLINQIKLFNPEYIYLKTYEDLKNFNVKVLTGIDGIKQIAKLNIDLFVNAVSGIDGIFFTYYLLKENKTLATANKEAIICLGEILKDKYKDILPIDSEHSAIFQTIENLKKEEIQNVILTSSGGPFFKWPKERLNKVSVEDALNHPKWSMGKKITIDSATLMNKGLEVIEAHYLFDIDYSKIKVIIHPQSIVHSLIELVDGTIFANLSDTDMRYPIGYALFYPERKDIGLKKLNLFEIERLEFYKPDFEKFPLLKLSIEAGKKGGFYPIVLTVADEIAVHKFLKKQIKFNDIYKIINETLQKANFQSPKTLEDILTVVNETKSLAENIL